jgi:hypothetical protein
MQTLFFTEKQKEKNYRSSAAWSGLNELWPKITRLTTEPQGTFGLFVEENWVQKKKISLTILGSINRKSWNEFYVWHTWLRWGTQAEIYWANQTGRIWHSQNRASWYILIIKPIRSIISQLYFGKELYMFRTDLLSIIRSLNIVFKAIGICHTSYFDGLLADIQHIRFTATCQFTLS